MITLRRSGRALYGLVAASGIAIGALSFVPGWLVHVRHVGGHGLTSITALWSAWEGRALPFLAAGVVVAVLVAVLALASVVRPARGRPQWLVAGALACLALLVGSAVPIANPGFASRVEMTAGWPLVAAIGLALVMLLAAGLSVGILAGSWRRLVAAAVAGGLVVLAVMGGRVATLSLAEGRAAHYADGSYVRSASGDRPAETLVIEGDTYAVEGRWSGNLEGRGLVAVLTDDPACPDARGTYRVWGAGGDDIRWNVIVDVCADGERARDLTEGIWQRSP